MSHTGEWIGPTNSLSLLLEHLAGRVDSSVLLTDSGRFTDMLRERDIPFRSLSTLGRRAIPSMINHLRSGRFDLVYTNNTSSASANALLAASLVGIPRVTHIRSLWQRDRWWDGRLFGRTQAQVAVSRAVAEAFASHVPVARPVVVYNGVPSKGTLVDRAAARSAVCEELSLAADSVLILCLAHVMPRKGQAEAVEAMAGVLARCREAVLLLVGRLDRDQDYVSAQRARVQELGIADRVRFLGFREDVDVLCRASDIQLHTAHVDPHPRAVIEGMASGLPTVAVGVDGVAETVVDGETGWLFEPHDTDGLAGGLVRLILEPEERDRMGRRARERATAEFTAERTAERVGDVIDSVLGRAVGNRPPNDTLIAKRVT